MPLGTTHWQRWPVTDAIRSSRRRRAGQRRRVPRPPPRSRGRDLAASLTPLSEEALHLKRSALVRCGRIDQLERVERSHQLIPFFGVRAEYPTSRSQMLARASSPRSPTAQRPTYLGAAKPLDHAGSSRNLSATPQHDRQAGARQDVQGRGHSPPSSRRRSASASFTVSLIVVVPSSARAAASVFSSRSTKCSRHKTQRYGRSTRIS